MRWYLVFILFLCLFGQATVFAQTEKNLSIYEKVKNLKVNVIFVRHALAPGFGDPKNFDLGNCSKQRNLNALGKVQAHNLGIFFRKNKLRFDEILSSEWCRCQETTALLDVGPWKTFAGLNSFFQGHVSKKNTLELLNKKLASIMHNGLVLMITHQVVISNITEKFVASGGVLLYSTTTGHSEIFDWEK